MTNLLTSLFSVSISVPEIGTAPVKMGLIWAGLGISLAVFLALYALRSVGLFVLAKRQRVKKYGLSFVPFVWIYVACKLVGKARFFNKPIEKLALIFTIIFAVSEFLTFAYNFIIYFPLFEYLVFHGGEVVIGTLAETSEMGIYLSIDGDINIYTAKQIVPFGVNVITIRKILDVIYYVSGILDIASIIITVTVYINLFRKFWPQHYMLASLISIFLGLFPIFVFVIRNKSAVNWADYMRSRYGAYGNPYGNPYNNPYNNQGNGAPNGQSPFSDFEKKKEEPFKDFEDKNKKDPFDEF